MEIFVYICFPDIYICRKNQNKMIFVFNITSTQRTFPLMAFFVNVATFFYSANWWEERRILDPICLYFLFGVGSQKVLLATLLCTYILILFSEVVKICQDLRSIGTSEHQENLHVLPKWRIQRDSINRNQ